MKASESHPSDLSPSTVLASSRAWTRLLRSSGRLLGGSGSSSRITSTENPTSMNNVSSTLRSSLAGLSAARLLACGIVALQCLLAPCSSWAANTIVGDGFGGRKWYKPSSFELGANTGSCIINGQLYLWGTANNQSLLLAPTAAATSAAPYAVPGFANTTFVSLNHTGAAIKADGTGWVWGNGRSYVNTTTSNPALFTRTATQVITGVKYCSAGPPHVSFIKTDGTVWSIGYNNGGGFGNGTTTNSTTTPVQMTGITNAVRVEVCGGGLTFTGTAMNPGATAVLRADGTVSIAGGYGRLQNIANDNLPHTIPGLTNIVSIAASYFTLAALDSTGKVYTIGDSSLAGLGDGTPISGSGAIVFTPRLVTFPSGAADIVAIAGDSGTVSTSVTYAIDANGTLYGWGTYVQGIKLVAPANSPIFCAHHVADIIVASGGAQLLVRNSNYPSNDALWMAGTTSSETSLTTSVNPPYGPNGELGTWSVCDPASVGLGGATTLSSGTGLDAINQTITTPYLTAVSGNLSTGNSVPSGTVFAIVTQPTNGTVSGLNASTGAYTYTPNASFSGTDTFTYSMAANGFTATATVTATVGSAPPTTDLAITKAASVTQVIPGAPFNYTLNITNTGAAATNVTANDTVPAGLTIQGTPTATNSGVVTVTGQNVKVVWPTMASGASNTVTINVVK